MKEQNKRIILIEGKTVRLFRLCSKDEIEALRNGGVDRQRFDKCLNEMN